MRVAIRNLHRTGIGGKHPFHDYILGFLQSGIVTHLFFEDLSLADPALAAIRKKYDGSALALDRVQLIFSAEALNRECDVLVSFDSRPEDFSAAVRDFPGLKVYHLMDYFWGEPLTEKLARLADHGVDYLLSYGSPDRYCPYFKAHGQAYFGKVIPLPFGFGPRFSSVTPFAERKQRCIALGSVRPLRFDDENPRKFEEQAQAFPGEIWFHKFRRMLVERKEELSDCMDSLLPEFPRYRDYDYDLPQKLNEYQLFVSDESLFYFPSAKAYEGPAAGTVMVCSDHPCFADFGFVDGVTCITHKEFDIADFHAKTKAALADQAALARIARAGTDFVRSRYSHIQIGRSLAGILSEVYAAHAGGSAIEDLAALSYEQYRMPAAEIETGHASSRSFLIWYVALGGLYCLIMDIASLPGRILKKLKRTLYPAKARLTRARRSFANREPAADRNARAQFVSQVEPLATPTPEERTQIEALRAGFSQLPVLPAASTAPERKWARFVAELQKKVATEDPRAFLSWEVIRNNMGYRAGSIELSFLQKQNDWTRWARALAEPAVTKREPFFLFPSANENTIRQAYHLAQFREATGIDPTSYDTIVDFGGGYGSMCRLVHALGFKGAYVIYDWKAFSLLQRFYLDLTGVPQPSQANTIDELAAALGTKRGKTLLIATWSMSEVSPAPRDAIVATVHPDGMLISYQKEFGGVDNQAYFSSFRAAHPAMTWHHLPMSYLPTEGNHYLFGVHE